MIIKDFKIFLESFKDDIQDPEELAKAEAILDITKTQCKDYKKLVSYLDSLYQSNNSVYVKRMLDDIIKAIWSMLREDDIVCSLISSIYQSVEDLETFAEVRWERSREDLKKKYKRKIMKEYFSSLIDGPDLDRSISGWKEFIEKKLIAAKYEHSFTKTEVFKSYETRLEMGNFSTIKSPLKSYVFEGKYTKEDILQRFNNIIKDESKMKLIKADLMCISQVKDNTGEVILNDGDLVEVKNKKWSKTDFLSEFFAIGKNRYGGKRVANIFRDSPEYKERYNDIIKEFYDILTIDQIKRGQEILDTVHNSFEGIMFASNIYVPSEFIELRWGLEGQRKNENRLSIIYSIKADAQKYQYIDDPFNIHFRKID